MSEKAALLKENVIKLRDERKVLDILSQQLSAQRELFDLQNATLIENIRQSEARVSEHDSKIRELAIELFDGTNKNIAHGVKIRIMTKLEYDDAVALNWAKSHDIALQLNKKEFESIAKTQSLDFVKVLSTPSATIPTEIVLEE